MQNNYQRLFVSLSIVIIYCVSVSELIYTDQYLSWVDTLNEKWNKEFYQIENKYRIAVGEESPAGQMAISHFKEKMIPKIFRSCTDGYYTIYQTTKSTYHPPKINKWYEPLYKKGTYSYHKVYKVYGFSEFTYKSEISDQTDNEIHIYVTLSGKAIHDGKWYEIAAFLSKLDYDLRVKKVEAGRDADALSVIGHSYSPYSYTCEYLQSHNYQYLN